MSQGSATFTLANLNTGGTDDLRATIGDTAGETGTLPAGRYLFSDAELQFFIDTEGDILSAAARAMYAAAASAAKLAIAISELQGAAQVDRQKVASEFRAAAKMFEERAEKREPFSVQQEWEDGDRTWIDFVTNRTAFDLEANV